MTAQLRYDIMSIGRTVAMPGKPTTLTLPKSDPKEVTAASLLIPYQRNDNRCKYLSWCACGFSDEEALYVLGLPYAWLNHQRQDEKFLELESRLPELRQTLSQEYSEIDFYRNFRMVLEKDYRVLKCSLGMDIDADTGEPRELSNFDQMYLLKLRTAYTPQQLQLIKQLSSGGSDGFNFAEWVSKNTDVIAASRTETIVARRQVSG